MREIKFRAKCKLLGRWMYGSLVIKKTGKVYINTTEVHPDTVGQYIGKRDVEQFEIDGKEYITEYYEDDCVYFFGDGSSVIKGEIVWDEDYFGFVIDGEDNRTYRIENTFIICVCGNIHEDGRRERTEENK